jgi:hypothetical protein
LRLKANSFYFFNQFNAGDELGNFNYGYANLNSVKQEVGNGYIGVSGSYQVSI